MFYTVVPESQKWQIFRQINRQSNLTIEEQPEESGPPIRR